MRLSGRSGLSGLAVFLLAPTRAAWHLWAFAFALQACIAWAAPGDLLPVPALNARVTDQTASLSRADEARIEALTRDFESKKGAQIAVLIVATTQPEPIFDYSLRVAEAWKLGRKGVDDGVLFVVAKEDRKMQILTGPGLSGALTDAMAKRIISEIVAPRFRANDFAGGIEQGVIKIIGVVSGEALPPPPAKRSGSSANRIGIEHILMGGLFTIVFVGPMLRAVLGRFLGASATGGLAGAAMWILVGGWFATLAVAIPIFLVVLLMSARMLQGGGWGGGGWGGGGWSGGGGSSDGGGFSGGGGSFDGGGASGDW